MEARRFLSGRRADCPRFDRRRSEPCEGCPARHPPPADYIISVAATPQNGCCLEQFPLPGKAAGGAVSSGRSRCHKRARTRGSVSALPASVASFSQRSTLRHSCALCLHLVTAFCSLLQNTPTQNQVEGSLQSELMPVHTSSPQTPPTEHIAQPPSTVDTAALSEDPLPGEGTTHLDRGRGG